MSLCCGRTASNERSALSAALRTQLTSMGALSMKPPDPDLESLCASGSRKRKPISKLSRNWLPVWRPASACAKLSASIASRPLKVLEGSVDVLPSRVSEDSRDRALLALRSEEHTSEL